MKHSRSLLVSWLLGATVVALVTFSFEALSEREGGAAAGSPVAAAYSVVTADAPACPAKTTAARCPATGATARSTAAPGRCPVSGATAGPAAPSSRCPVSGATAAPAFPSGRCPAGGGSSVPLRTGHTI